LKLFKPINIHGMELENRIIFPAVVSRLASEDGYVTEALRERVLRIATGGVGLIVLEAAGIMDRKSGTLLKIFDDKFISGLKELAEEVHRKSKAKLGIQLVHFLKLSRSGYRQTVEELSLNDIEQIVEDFGAAALRVKKAGFDSLEIHCAHAYTLSSFLSLRNKRKDEYGRNIEGRMRIVKEVLAKVKSAVGEDFPLGCRLNGDEFILGGNTLQQSRLIAANLANWGIHYLSVSAGGKFEDGQVFDGIAWPYSGYSGTRTMPTKEMPDGVNVYLAEEIRKIVSPYGIPVATAGKIPTPEFAEAILEAPKADLIALGRPLICDPDWPNKAKDFCWHDIVYCKYCGKCTDNDRNFEPVVCSQWPKGSLNAPADFLPRRTEENSKVRGDRGV
jgi:2,4-dienoyl-CoA reductase-like NADH-dependent reductase (Old Yellow Enzyme family)